MSSKFLMTSNRQLIVVLLAIITSSALSQRADKYETFDRINSNKHVRQFVWGDYQALNNYGAVPEVYGDEPAVYLEKEGYESIKYFIIPTQETATVVRKILYREIVKIQNKKAIELFSIYHVKNLDTHNDDVGIRIIKPTGEMKEYGIDDLLKEEKNNEERIADYRLGIYTTDIYKMAIPNLEVGDIIDYYKYVSEKSTVQPGFNTYGPDNIYFVDKFPIVHQRYQFILKKNTYMIFSALNGAPEPYIFTDEEVQDNGVRRRVVFEDSLRDKLKIEESWMYPLLVYPNVRYQQAVGKAIAKYMQISFFDKEEKATSTRTMEDIMLMIESRKMPTKKREATSRYQTGLKYISGKKYASELEEANDFYDFLRFRYETIYRSYNNVNANNMATIKALSYLLTTKKIKHDVLYYVPRNIGTLDNMLAREDVKIALKIYWADTVTYAGMTGNCALLTDMPYSLQGVDAYSLSVYPPLPAHTEPTRVKVPALPASENTLNTTMTLDLDGEILNAKVNYKATGALKTEWQSDYISFNRIQMDDKSYAKSIDVTLGVKGIDYNLIYVEDEEMATPDLKDKEKYSKYRYNATNIPLMKSLRTRIEKKFGERSVENLDSCRIIHTGRYAHQPGFEMQTQFVLNDYVKRLGSDIMVNMGALIGSQVDLADDERIRNVDVFMDVARVYHNTITLKVPDGYEVEGLDKLNINVENETGLFKAVSAIIDDTLVVKTKKMYKHIYEPNENWKTMQEFLDAAFDFSQQKVLFRKK